MNLITTINLENVYQAETASYKRRYAVRAIVTDENGDVAIFHATKNGYYKIPGGGIEEGETNEQAIMRECKEEIGCDIELTGEIGMIVEYRKKYQLHQESYCYTAKLVGAKGSPQLMPDEIEEGFQPEWMPLDKAIELVRSGDRVIYEAQYMIARDTAFLEAFKKNS